MPIVKLLYNAVMGMCNSEFRSTLLFGSVITIGALILTAGTTKKSPASLIENPLYTLKPIPKPTLKRAPPLGADVTVNGKLRLTGFLVAVSNPLRVMDPLIVGVWINI